MNMIKSLFLATILSIALISCEREGSGKCEETNISTATRASHNAGETCTKCHSLGEDGNGCFTIAGTAYKKDKSTPLTDAVMVLFNREEYQSTNQGTSTQQKALTLLENTLLL